MTKLEWKEYVQTAVSEAAGEFGNINVLAKIKNVDKGTLYKWRNGRSIPKVDTFLRAFPEYNFAGIENCVFETRGASTKSTRPLPTNKKLQEELEKYCTNDEDATFEFATRNNSYIISKCTNCVHHKVCKYSEDFYKLEERLNEEFSIIKTGMIIAHARIDCDEFEEAAKSVLG